MHHTQCFLLQYGHPVIPGTGGECQNEMYADGSEKLSKLGIHTPNVLSRLSRLGSGIALVLDGCCDLTV